ncbi:albumin-binding GA domain-containing protein [Lactobacillus iners]|uniref:albumin-binding GA domain-containing protein n=3 Tax=Bacteria TaxID=2 RepID=UPI00254DFCBB|nr:albumin-binding GA domain-containing protein [Lactobacillus iners]MDK7363023.1 albumin-binding GA domain-containing protein [Lactobacillus iners]
MKKERLDKFSIRKLTVGAASVLIGVAFGATTVSAEKQPTPQAQAAGQQAAQVTELKDVKFTFKMGDKLAITEPVTVYVTKDGHYGFENDAAKCTSTAAQIVSAFLDKVTTNDDIKNAQGVAYPEKINAGENTVEVAAKPASNPVEHSDADLQKEAEKKADELTNSPAFFKAELKDAEHDLQVAKDTVAQAEQEGSLSQEEMAKLQDDVAKAEAKVNELKNSSAFVEVQLKDAEHELEVAKDAVAQAEQEGGLSQEEMGKLQDEVAKAEAKVNELKAKVTPAPEPVKPTPVVPTPEPKPEETTYHFTYKGAETTVSTDYVAASVDKAEQYFRAYASESGLNLDFTYDEATHTFVGTDAKPAKTVYHFSYDDKKGNSIRQDFATTSKDTAEMHFRAYASDNALSIDDAHFTYDEATHTFVYKDFESEKGEPEVQPEAPVQKIVFHFQYDDKKGTSIRQDFAAVNKEIAEMHFKEYATESGLVLDDAHFAYNEANQTFVYKDFESEKGEPEVLPAPAVDVLAEAKKVAHEEFTKAGITGKIFHDAIDAAKTVEGLQAYVAETLAAHKTPAVDALAEAKKAAHEEFTKAGITGKIFHDAIDAAKTVEGLQAYVAETLKAHKTVEPVTPTPAPVVSGETGIGYLNLDMLSDGFTGTLYVPVVGKDVNCKVRLLDDAGKYTNDYVVTDTTVKALASKVVNGVTFYKVAENRWIPAKFAEVLSDKEVAFKGVAKTFVKGHANYAVAMLDANGKYTGKFLKQGSSFKVFAKKVINGHLCYRLGTQAQWVPARFLVF